MHKTHFKLADGSDGTDETAAPAIALRLTTASERTLIAKPAREMPVQGAAWDDFLIRVFDVVVALALLVVLAPLLVLIAIAILMVDGRPVIFAHRRVGKDGGTFPCYKFRSMYRDSEERLNRLLSEDPALRREWNCNFKLANDPRVTPIGNWLRVTSLDELPQLFNVLGGSMSLVGPRPIIEAEMDRYGRYIDHYLSVRPGVTGIWQVSGRSETSYQRRVAADVLYVRSRSLRRNVRILVATIPAVLTGEGSC